MTAIVIGGGPLFKGYIEGSNVGTWRGGSSDAKLIEKTSKSKVNDFTRPATRLIKSKLLESVLEARTSNWDGYGAEPLKLASLKAALVFISELKSLKKFPEPEFSVDPDGEIALDWIQSRYKMFSISFSVNNRVSYAGLFGVNKVRGSEYFSNEIPKQVKDCLSRLYKQG